MTHFQRSITRFTAFLHPRRLRWLPMLAALAAIAAAPAADAAIRHRAAGAYDGIWNVVFATTRGNCSSGYSVPFAVIGSRVSSAGGGRVSGSVNRAGVGAGRGSGGASRASGGGRVVGRCGAGRGGGVITGGYCGGTREATRSCLFKKRNRPVRYLTGRSISSDPEFKSARRQYHHDLAAFETRVLLDLGELGDVGLDLVQELGADFLVRHFAAAVAQGDLDLVAFLEEPLHRAHLHVVVVIVDHRPQLDLLDLDDLLLLAGLGGFFLRGIFELPVVHDLANGRIIVRRNLDKVHAGFDGHLDGNNGLDRSMVEAGLINQLDL